MRITGRGVILFLCLASLTPGRQLISAELRPETLQAFERYIQGVEAQVDERVKGKRNFLWVDDSAERRTAVVRGEVPVASLSANSRVPHGLIHDWMGAAFLRGVKLSQVLALVKDYDNHKIAYQPEVIGSRILSQNGNDYKIWLRLKKKKVITAVLNTEHEVHYHSLDQTRWYSRSYSTRIAEVQDAGGSKEHDLPVGRDHGFLWRLYSYWRFEERDGGVYIECRAVSLTRDVPAGFGWLIQPIVRELPRESLEHTLRATRVALMK